MAIGCIICMQVHYSSKTTSTKENEKLCLQASKMEFFTVIHLCYMLRVHLSYKTTFFGIP